MPMRAKELAERWRKSGNVTDSDIDWMVNRLADIESAVQGEVGAIQERHHAYMGRPTRHKDHPVVVQFADDIATLLAIVRRQAEAIVELQGEADNHSIANRLWQEAEQQRDAARAEVERLKERCARDDAGVTIHACPPKGEGMMPCCDRPPFEVMGDRMTTNPALVNCDRQRLMGEIERLKATLGEHDGHPHFYICPQVAKSAADMGKERDALKVRAEAAEAELAAEKQRADVLAEGVRLFWGDNGWSAAAALEWKRKHGHLVGDGK